MKEFKKLTLTIFLILWCSLIIILLINEIKNRINTDEKTNEPQQQTALKLDTYTFLKVIDWDTLKVKNNNEEINIRMIGLDAPEKSTTRYWYTECFWNEATNHLNEILSWITTIQVEQDPTQWETDKYWRLLWYVFFSWNNINQKMIEDGYWFEYTYNLPYKYQKEFKKAEKSARLNKLWLWDKNTCNWERREIKD
jgi:micrococcal nuclease